MAFALLSLVCLWPSLSQALPLYTAREGRTCDNCHTLPNNWKNPEQIKDRKCHMSCAICHVDPTGGGLRNVSGRFYGQTSLSMTLSTQRGYKDKDRFLFPGLSALEEAPYRREADAYAKARAARDQARRAAEEARASLVRTDAAIITARDELGRTEAQFTAAQATLQEADRALSEVNTDTPAASLSEELYRDALLSRRAAAAAALDEATRAKARATLDLQAAQDAQDAARRDATQAEAHYQQKRGGVRGSFLALQEGQNWLPTPAFGNPRGQKSIMSFDDSRYGGLKADPLLALGLDARFASWTADGDTAFFPMQFDTQAAIQPVEHVTAYINAGVLAKTQGLAATLERQNPYAVKDAFVMVHELPYNLYARVGSFIPQFGIRQEDHTVFTRRDFELDHGIRESRVFGAEVGLAPNYPYASVAVFRPNQRDQFGAGEAPFFGVGGAGAALNLGYRELGWQVGASFLARRRALEDGGNTDSINLQWGFNPWYYTDSLPLTYLGEYALGTLQRPLSGVVTLQAAASHELGVAAANGINLKLKYDYADPDFAVRGDTQHRFGAGADLTLLPGLRWSFMARTSLIPEGRATDALDFFTYLRLWL